MIETLVEKHIFEDIRNLLIEYKPRVIIELGTYKAGFTNTLADWFPDIQIYTFDWLWMLDKRIQDETRKKGNVTIIVTQQLFKNDYILSLLLALPIKKFVFCDNGHKIDEVKLYAQCLRPGDLLGLHDWNTEINSAQVGHVLQEFEQHEINEKLSKPGYSKTRFFIRKSYQGKHKLSTTYLNMGQNGEHDNSDTSI